MEPTRIVFLVYPNVTQLDLTGPAQVLSRLPDARVDLAWKTRDPVPDRQRLRLASDGDDRRGRDKPTSSAFRADSAAST